MLAAIPINASQASIVNERLFMYVLGPTISHLSLGLELLDSWQPGDLGVLRRVSDGFTEEARTRGFPSPSFGGFGFVKIINSK
jgi:hypothetical protein